MRSVKRPTRYEGIVRQLAENPHPSTGRSIFPTMRELLCFAAVLGFSSGTRGALDGAVNEIDGRIFDNSDQALDLIYLISLAEAQSTDILRPDNEDRMLQIFEEYAAAGLGILERWLSERADDVYGSEAIFAALRKYGYVGDSSQKGKSVDPGDVTF